MDQNDNLSYLLRCKSRHESLREIWNTFTENAVSFCEDARLANGQTANLPTLEVHKTEMSLALSWAGRKIECRLTYSKPSSVLRFGYFAPTLVNNNAFHEAHRMYVNGVGDILLGKEEKPSELSLRDYASLDGILFAGCKKVLEAIWVINQSED